jgi:phospholipid/cholesterol/gamma-HCH transport system substrate-binding protein
MEKPNQSLKIGIFALAALVLAAVLILNFSKSAGPWTSQIRITIESTEVGGLTSGAKVMMAGVAVGHVESLNLGADGRKVLIHCAILKKYRIHRDAKVEIQQSGFLGDQYVSITPNQNEGGLVDDGDNLVASPPFNMLEAARSAAGLLQRLDATASKLDSAVARVDRVLLAEGALRDLTNGFANFNRLSERADVALSDIQQLVRSNSPAIGLTLSNLSAFAVTLQGTATNLNSVVDANKAVVQNTLANLSVASGDVKAFTAELRSGQGLVGAAFKDEKMRDQFQQMIGNLTVVSSNLSRYGILWKPRSTSVWTNDTRYSGRGALR